MRILNYVQEGLTINFLFLK